MLNIIQNPITIGMLTLTGLAVITDATEHKIPNILVFFGLIAGFVCQIFASEGFGGLQWLIGVFVGFISFLPLYLIRAMAAGDVKLMAAAGGFLGFPLVLDGVIFTYIFGAVFGFLLVIWKGLLSQLLNSVLTIFSKSTIRKSDADHTKETSSVCTKVGRMPFALAIAMGSLSSMYL